MELQLLSVLGLRLRLLVTLPKAKIYGVWQGVIRPIHSV